MPQLDDKGVSLDVGVCTEEHVKCILVNKNYYYYYCLYYCYLPISFYKDFGPSFFVKYRISPNKRTRPNRRSPLDFLACNILFSAKNFK